MVTLDINPGNEFNMLFPFVRSDYSLFLSVSSLKEREAIADISQSNIKLEPKSKMHRFVAT